MWLCRFPNRHVGFLNNIIHPGFQELHCLDVPTLSINFVIFIQVALFLQLDPAVAGMWLCRFRDRQV